MIQFSQNNQHVRHCAEPSHWGVQPNMKIENFPLEITIRILRLLGPKDCIQLCSSSSTLYTLLEEPALWQHFCWTRYRVRAGLAVSRELYQKYLVRFGFVGGSKRGRGEENVGILNRN